MRSLISHLTCASALALWLVAGTFAQTAQADDIQAFDEPERPNLRQELGLSNEQVRQIRMINRERKPVMESAQARLREANQALDLAIYSDNVDESLVSVRLREFQAAQAEVARIRFRSEFALRKILNPDQLLRFRDLRQRLAEARKEKRQQLLPKGTERPAVNRIRKLPRGRIRAVQ